MLTERIFLKFKKDSNRILCLHTLDNRYLNVDKFECFIRHCTKLGINILPLKEILKKPIGNNIALCFDDGYRDNVEVLLPVLKKHNLQATLFLVTNHLNKSEGNLDLLNASMYNLNTCSKAEIEAWQISGMDIGYHTHSHINLFDSSDENIEKDFIEGDEIFEALNRNSYKFFAYPFGYLPRNRAAFVNLLNKHNYEVAFTTSWGDIEKNNKFYVKRVSIGDQDSLRWMLWKTIGLLDFYYKLKMENEKNKI